MRAKRVLGWLSPIAMSIGFSMSGSGCSQSSPSTSSGTNSNAGGASSSSSSSSSSKSSTSTTGGSSSVGGSNQTSSSTSEGGSSNQNSSNNQGGSSAQNSSGNQGGSSTQNSSSASGGSSSHSSQGSKAGGSGGSSSSLGSVKTGGTSSKPVDGAGGAPPSGTTAGGAAGAPTGAGGSCSGAGCASGGAGNTAGSNAVNGGGTNGGASACGADVFKDFASGKLPKDVGLKLTQLFNSQAVDTTKHYKTACTWWGSLMVAGLTKDASQSSLISKFDQLKTDFVATSTERNHVDDNVFGIVPLEIYLQNGDKTIRDLGLALADHQIANIDSPDQKRMAIDDMFMITELQVQAYRAADADKKSKYLDFAADIMVEYLAMQQKDGCFYQKEGANAKWGRGNGWFAVGMAEMMRELSPSHKQYQTIRTGYEKMMKGLLDYQIKSGEGAGIWYQVIDSKDAKNWPETSGSAMFTYAMITGVKLCILDAATYGAAARTAWNALTDSKYLGTDGKLKEISDWCYWQPSEGDALAYYTGRPKVVGDGHGQGPLLWSAAALLR